jgi:drug/metabolite transporter (DMT)-like permease
MIISFIKSFLTNLLVLAAVFYFAAILPAGAEDINAVFTDINTKTTSIMDWVTNYLIYLLCLIAFIAWAIAMLFKKMSYVEGITILIIIILIGFAPTIVGYLVHKS